MFSFPQLMANGSPGMRGAHARSRALTAPRHVTGHVMDRSTRARNVQGRGTIRQSASPMNVQVNHTYIIYKCSRFICAFLNK
jgi:hypothetical protein